jgi:hypothetical protein
MGYNPTDWQGTIAGIAVSRRSKIGNSIVTLSRITVEDRKRETASFEITQTGFMIIFVRDFCGIQLLTSNQVVDIQLFSYTRTILLVYPEARLKMRP